MKRYLLTILLIAFLHSGLQGQTFFEENFDSYTVGGYLGTQSTVWSTWSGSGAGTTEDTFITSDQAASGMNSLACIGGGDTDVILPFNNFNEGEYTIDLSIFVTSGNGAYYNFQEDQSPGIAWAFEIYFSDDGTWELIKDMAQVLTGTYASDTWIRMSHVIDLVNGTMAIYQDGAPSGEIVFDSPLGAINIYPTAPTGQNAYYYIDDVYVYKSKEDFEDYANGNFLGNVSQQWSTWSGMGAGTTEDGIVSNTYSNIGSNSANFVGGSDVIYPLGNFSAGIWELSMKLYTEVGSGGYLNIQHDEVPGISSASQIYFNGTSGVLDAGGANAATFDWSDASWHQVVWITDLDTDLAELIVDGISVHTWPFSDEAISAGTGVAVLGGISFFPNGALSGTPSYILDNMTFRRTDLQTSDPGISSLFEEFTLFPNPTNSIAFIQNNSNENIEVDIRIHNGIGQLVQQQFKYFEVDEVLEINTTSWNTGLYFIEFLGNNTNITIKLIID